MAFLDHDLTAAEREYAFTASQEFHAALPLLRQFIESHQDHKAITFAEIQTAWNAGLPTDLIPFWRQKQTAHNDYYCVHRTNSNRVTEIVVFADHAIVYNWKDTAAFLQWLTLQ